MVAFVLPDPKGALFDDNKRFRVFGSGFLQAHAKRTLVVTARHVMEDYQRVDQVARGRGLAPPGIRCFLQQESVVDEDGDPAIRVQELEVSEPRLFYPSDIAILDAGGLPSNYHQPLVLSAVAAQEGDWVGCCGFPLSSRLQFPERINSFLSAGRVSAILPYSESRPLMRTRLQIDAFAAEGSSGGPVFSPASGDVLGMVVQAASESARSEGGGRILRLPLGFGFAEDVARLRIAVERHVGLGSDDPADGWFQVSAGDVE